MFNLPLNQSSNVNPDVHQKGIVKTMFPYVNPLSLRNQMGWTAANYMLKPSIWQAATTEGLKWQGVAGTRWLGGGMHGAGAGLTGRFGRLLSYAPTRLGQAGVSKIYGKAAGEAFYKRGLKGVLELADAKQGTKVAQRLLVNKGFLYKASQFFSGGEEVILMGTKETAKAVAKKTVAAGRIAASEGTRAANPTFLKVVSKQVIKRAGIVAKVANIAGWIALAAGGGYQLGKATTKFVDRQLFNIAERLHTLGTPDVFDAPQMVNKYSMSMRDRALQEIHKSGFSPRNMLLGREAEYMHR